VTDAVAAYYDGRDGFPSLAEARRRRRATRYSFTGTKVDDDEEYATFFDFSAVCYYFAESVTDYFLLDGRTPPPIGLIQSALGGTEIQKWTPTAVFETCSDFETIKGSQSLYDNHVVPFSNTTVKGFLWYQGEQNMGSVFGNAHQERGYSCALSKMIAAWRGLFSAVPGTTDPMAPFGIVTLTGQGDEGHPDIGGMYLAQTGGHGVLPNPDMPNTFLAVAFDLDDPYMNNTCVKKGCVPMKVDDAACAGCEGYAASAQETPTQGAVHPRVKKPIGDRLARGAYASVYGGNVHATGPVLSGCKLKGNKLTIKFNRTLLGTDKVEVGDYYRPTNATYLQILTNQTLFCLQAVPIKSGKKTKCLDDGNGKSIVTKILGPWYLSGLLDRPRLWWMYQGTKGKCLVFDMAGCMVRTGSMDVAVFTLPHPIHVQ